MTNKDHETHKDAAAAAHATTHGQLVDEQAQTKKNTAPDGGVPKNPSMLAMNQLTNKVGLSTNVQVGAVDMIKGIAAQIDLAKDDKALAELSASLKANAEVIANAIVANTPAATMLYPPLTTA